jgi:predicted 3-demethylubiquinone-9 3-methyltransferase (glyoxalase superfamily)
VDGVADRLRTQRAVDEQVGQPAPARTDGVTWQIVPSTLGKYLGGPDRAGAQRAMAAMLGMVKLDIEGLRRAYEG